MPKLNIREQMAAYKEVIDRSSLEGERLHPRKGGAGAITTLRDNLSQTWGTPQSPMTLWGREAKRSCDARGGGLTGRRRYFPADDCRFRKGVKADRPGLAYVVRGVGRKIAKHHRAKQTPHGKQSVKKLMAHGASGIQH